MARQNYATASKTSEDKLNDLANKSEESPWAKFKCFLASKKVYIGDLYRLNKAKKKFDRILEMTTEQGILQVLSVSGIYQEASNSKEMDQIITTMRGRAKRYLKEGESAFVFLPNLNQKQYLKAIIIKNSSEQFLESKRLFIYLGYEGTDKPRFAIKDWDGETETMTEVTGLEELKRALTKENDDTKIRSFDDLQFAELKESDTKTPRLQME